MAFLVVIWDQMRYYLIMEHEEHIKKREGIKTFWLRRSHVESIERLREKYGCRSDGETVRMIIEAVSKIENVWGV